MARSTKHCRFCIRGLAGTIRDPTATEATMKLFMLFTVAALIVGGIYRTEVSQYFADLSIERSKSGGGTSVVNSIQGVGNAQNALLGQVGSALDR